jgi:hypothetical protein
LWELFCTSFLLCVPVCVFQIKIVECGNISFNFPFMCSGHAPCIQHYIFSLLTPSEPFDFIIIYWWRAAVFVSHLSAISTSKAEQCSRIRVVEISFPLYKTYIRHSPLFFSNLPNESNSVLNVTSPPAQSILRTGN